MSKHRETGARGERIAEEFLITNGYQILHRNWRTARKEIDLIALDGDEIVFVEIKTRSGLGFGAPEESVNFRKQKNIREAAEVFSLQYPEEARFRFDVVCVLLSATEPVILYHIQDAF